MEQNSTPREHDSHFQPIPPRASSAGGEIRAELIRGGVLRPFGTTPRAPTRVDLPLDDLGILFAARRMFAEFGDVALERIAEQADPRVAAALRVLAARHGVRKGARY